MDDPYKVLGVPYDATDEQIKTAYRELAKRYHPDNNQGSPMQELAEQKMEEINAAYDQIQQDRLAGGGTRSGSRAGGARFSDVRNMINTGRIEDADLILEGISPQERDAEWHFLKGSIYYTKGWLNEAYTQFQAAASADPNNNEYRAALNQMQYQRQTGYPRGNANPFGGGMGGSGANSGCSICDICTAMYCANCLCNCLGGGRGC